VAINTNKPVELSEDEVAAWEGKPENRSRGKIQMVQFPSDENPEKPARFWVAKPNRQQLGIIADSSGNTTKANEIIINTGVIAGDTAQLEYDDAMFFGLLSEVQSLVEAKKKI
jgi:hypothetical protein